MLIQNAVPKFGGRKKPDEYYMQVNSIIRVLRGYSTLRTIADALNAQQFKTPSDKEWNRDRLASYLKTNKITKGD